MIDISQINSQTSKFKAFFIRYHFKLNISRGMHPPIRDKGECFKGYPSLKHAVRIVKIILYKNG